jgi:hypothetical protein
MNTNLMHIFAFEKKPMPFTMVEGQRKYRNLLAVFQKIFEIYRNHFYIHFEKVFRTLPLNLKVNLLQTERIDGQENKVIPSFEIGNPFFQAYVITGYHYIRGIIIHSFIIRNL